MALLSGARAYRILGVVVGRYALQQRAFAAGRVGAARIKRLCAADQHRLDLAAGEHASGLIDELLRHLAADPGDSCHARCRAESAREFDFRLVQQPALGAYDEEGVEVRECAGAGEFAGLPRRHFHHVDRVEVGRLRLFRLGYLSPAADHNRVCHAGGSQLPVRVAMSAKVRISVGRKRS